jgi:tRNA nucleotidyltransferase (CCA-adding enzyme)
MVGKGPGMTRISTDNLAEGMNGAYPELEAVRAAASDPVYLVGGAVRDLLLGHGRSANLDLVVEGDAAGLAARLGGAEALEHERFATATVRLDGLEVDVAAARTETYAHPGALPEVRPGAGIEADLSRRDFTINAIAVSIEGDPANPGAPAPIDPTGGGADLEAGLLRVIHDASFADDPTRALRAARYASRLGFALEPGTEELLRATDLDAVSADRREAELLRLAAEPQAARGFELLAEWGLAELRPGGVELAGRVAALLAEPPWRDFAPRAPAVLRAALGPEATGAGSGTHERELAAADPDRPSDAVELAAHHDPVELAVARGLGAEWLDRYLSEWRAVGLEIAGADLIEAGVAEGPALGRGLAGALRMKLDGELEPGREAELAAALAAALDGDGLA